MRNRSASRAPRQYSALRLFPDCWAAAMTCSGALTAFIVANPPRLKKKPEAEDLTAKLFLLAREKPIVAAAAILGAAAVALKNPKVTAAMVGTFMATRAQPKK